MSNTKRPPSYYNHRDQLTLLIREAWDLRGPPATIAKHSLRTKLPSNQIHSLAQLAATTIIDATQVDLTTKPEPPPK